MIRFAALLFLATLPAAAQRSIEPNSEVPNEAHVARTWPLVEREWDGTFLRVAFQLTGPIATTDATPPYGLHLSIYVLFPEWGSTDAVWTIDYVFSADPPRRTDAGIYEIDVRAINTQQSMAMDCFIADMTLEIDARQASIAARNSEPAEFFGYGVIEEPIFVTQKSINCAQDQSWAIY